MLTERSGRSQALYRAARGALQAPPGGGVAGQLLDLLATDPDLSNRELARRSGFDHHYVAGFRAALALTEWGPLDRGGKHGSDLGPTLNSHPVDLVGRLPPSGTPCTPGHTVAGHPPALNSWHFWVRATERERTKFVDAVGLHHLLAAAPPDHRDAFRRAVVVAVTADAEAEDLRRARASDTGEDLGIPADLSIPSFLLRAREDATSTSTSMGT
jgi:hypothetical protein